MDTNSLKKMRRFRGTFRFIGFCWVLVCGMLLVAFVPLVLDRSASITWNGVPTTAFGAKLSATLFVGMFVLVGACALFAPARLLNRLYIWQQSAVSAIAFWRH